MHLTESHCIDRSNPHLALVRPLPGTGSTPPVPSLFWWSGFRSCAWVVYASSFWDLFVGLGTSRAILSERQAREQTLGTEVLNMSARRAGRNEGRSACRQKKLHVSGKHAWLPRWC